MDAIDFHDLQIEKAKSISRFYRLPNVTKLFRLFELCLALVVFFWAYNRLPFAVRISGEYFRRLVIIVVDRLFIFMLGNVIVLTLLFKSRGFSGQIPITTNTETDLCEEFIKNSDNRNVFGLQSSSPVPAPEEEIVYQDKQTIFEVNTSRTTMGSKSDEVKAIATDKVPESRTYWRSQSENLTRESSGENCTKFRRSETEKCRKIANPREIPAETVYMVDELSSEDFQRTIEAFIARQVKFHQEEKLAIVLHRHA